MTVVALHESSASTQVDVTNCDREPIHVIGHIQPHGALLVFAGADVGASGRDLRVVQASANAAVLLGLDDAPVTGRTLDSLVGPTQGAALAEAATEAAVDAAGRAFHPVRVIVGDHGRAFDAVAHWTAAGLTIELEPAPDAPPMSAFAFNAVVRRTMARLARGTRVGDVAQQVAEEVRALTGYDRVWVYRFHADWHGEIIAESADASLESWMGLHYPASDIPAPARALFLRHWVRVIADAHYEPAAIEPPVSPVTGAPLDLSDSVLRGVSPMHRGYLANMGVRASMSVSLVRDGVLWGLVSCHHYGGPLTVPYDVRAACELLGQAFSTQLAAVEEVETRADVARLAELRHQLLEQMVTAGDVVRGMTEPAATLLALAGAEGAAVCLTDGAPTLVGRTPDAEQVTTLVAWLAERGQETLATDALGTLFPPAAAYAEGASGMLAVALSRVRPYYVLWFRPQAVQTIAWGGDPHTKGSTRGADGVPYLSPRASFARWEEEVRGHSHPWRGYEVDAARALRGVIIDLLITRADELAALNRELASSNDELTRSNRELDDFTFVASHDLREPLRGIHNYAAIVREDYVGVPLDADGAAKLDTITRLARRLDTLIESLLHYSRVGRLDLERTAVDMNAAFDDAMERVMARRTARKAEVVLTRPLPTVRADRERVVEVLFNLLSNAIKYGDPDAPHVEVGWESGADGIPVFFVRDNGIGIAPEDHAEVFRLFRRLHARDAYGGGSGAGLTIVQKIVERHGGRVWLESALGAGTTFYFTLEPGATGTGRGGVA